MCMDVCIPARVHERGRMCMLSVSRAWAHILLIHAFSPFLYAVRCLDMKRAILIETAFYAGSVPHCHSTNLEKIIMTQNSRGRRACVFVCIQWNCWKKIRGQDRRRETEIKDKNKIKNIETGNVIMVTLSSSIFSTNKYPLSWHNLSRILLFFTLALMISQEKNKYPRKHLRYVIVSLFKGKHTQSIFYRCQLQGYTAWSLLDALIMQVFFFCTFCPSIFWEALNSPLHFIHHVGS